MSEFKANSLCAFFCIAPQRRKIWRRAINHIVGPTSPAVHSSSIFLRDSSVGEYETRQVEPTLMTTGQAESPRAPTSRVAQVAESKRLSGESVTARPRQRWPRARVSISLCMVAERPVS